MSETPRVILVPPTPSEPTAPEPAAFRDNQLGGWSSHPHFAAAKLRALRIATLLTGGAAFGILALAWAMSFEWSDVTAIILQFSAWFERQAEALAVLGCVLGGFGAFLVVASLQVRASLVGRMRAGEASVGRLGWSLGLLALCGVVGATLFASAWSSSALWARVALTSLAVAPLPLLALYLEFAAEDAELGKASIAPARLIAVVTQISLVVLPFVLFQIVGEFLSGSVSGWLTAKLTSVGPAAWLSGTTLTADAPQWLRDISEGRFGALAKDAWESAVAGLAPTITDAAARVNEAIRSTLDPVVRRFCRVASVLALLPALMMAIGLSIKIIRQAASAAEPTGGESPAVKPRGWIRRLFDWLVAPLRWLRTKFKGRHEEQAREGERNAELPPWVEGLIKEVPDGVESIVQSVPDPTTSVAEPSTDATFDWLFGGVRPSVDQVAAVRLLHEARVAAIRDEATGEGRIGAGRHADFFLEADGGAGASSTLDAMAVAGAITRGQRVLYLCPSAEMASFAVSRIAGLLKRARLSEIFVVGRLDAINLGRGSDPGRERDRGQVAPVAPDILVGTLDEWEELIQPDEATRESMISVVLDVELILVDDFGRGRGKTQEAMHLPFILDKHRLLLASESRVVQTVVVIPPIGDGGEGIEEILSKRLFGGNMAPRSCRLRRWRADTSCVFDVHLVAEPLAETRALKAMVKVCLEQGLKVLVLKSGADPERRSEIADRLAFNGRAPQVLVSSDEIGDSDRGNADAVFLRWGLRGDSVTSIAAKLDDGSTIFFRFVPDSSDEPLGDEITVPVLASARSRAFALAHLRSAYTLLEPNVPIHRGYWAMLGLRDDDDVAHFHEEADSGFLGGMDAPSLLIDPPEAAPAGDDTPECLPPDVWQFVARKGISHVAQTRRPLSAPPADTSRVTRTDEGATILFGQSRQPPDPRRYATWSTERGTKLGRVDLALCDRLLYEEGRQRYHAIGTRSSGAAAESHFIRGDFYHAEAHELSIPVLEVEFAISADAAVDGPQSLVTAAVEWYDFIAGQRPVTLTTSIVGLADEEGKIAVCDRLEFETEVGVSVLTIGMPMPHEQRHDWVRAYFGGAWKSSMSEKTHGPAPRAFWPALTMVMHIALRRLMPDLLRFARVLAFHPPSDGAGAVIFFLEPLSTAGTAGEPVRAVLRRPSLRARLAEAIESALTRLRRGGKVHGWHPLAMSPTYKSIVDAGRPTEGELDAVAHLLSLLSRGLPESTSWVPTGQVGLIVSPHDPRDRRWSPASPGAPVEGYPSAPGGGSGGQAFEEAHDHTWRDVHGARPRAWQRDMEEVGNPDEGVVHYGIKLDDFASEAESHNVAFGYDPEQLKEAQNPHEYASVRGFQCGQTSVRPDYAWIVAQAQDSVRGLAHRIVALAERAGATTERAKITAIYSFVRSLRYETIQPLEDGKERHGIRLPTEMLEKCAGDCDSACLLFLSLLAAAGLGAGGLVTTHDHAMVALDVPFDADSEDWLDLRGHRYLMAECTHAEDGRIGRVAADYVREPVVFHAIPTSRVVTPAD